MGPKGGSALFCGAVCAVGRPFLRGLQAQNRLLVEAGAEGAKAARPESLNKPENVVYRDFQPVPRSSVDAYPRKASATETYTSSSRIW
ncbi:MAG: hypothetical protein AMS16_06115, partial [Planctomycetes bacterium DG_58]